VDPKFAASVLTNILQFLKREGIDTLALDEPRMLSFFLAYKEGVFAKAASQEILKEMCLDEGATPLSAAKKLGLTKLSGKELASIIEKEKLDFSSLMAKYRLRIDAAEAEALFKK
jgi:Glu-tRNA(Gln) amidotransferase subunit E-like FAD-binding protein